MTFLYPTSRQFPFDAVCEQIVRNLVNRNFNVEGITIKLDHYNGWQDFQYVSTIRGNDFRLWFCRTQGSLGGGRNDIAAVTELRIPGFDLSVYEDESGPSLEMYIGDNWDKDREWFLTGTKVNSKLNGQPRRYLCYKGSWKKPYESGPDYSYGNQRAPYLVHHTDLGREYDLKEGDFSFFETKVVFEHFKKWLTEHVLPFTI